MKQLIHYWPLMRTGEKALLIISAIFALVSVIIFCFNPSFKAFNSALTNLVITLLLTGWTITLVKNRLLDAMLHRAQMRLTALDPYSEDA